jgi:hypothetical protein
VLSELVSSTVSYQPKTASDMAAIYRFWRGMWKLKGAEAEFVVKYGSERKWVAQFTKRRA